MFGEDPLTVAISLLALPLLGLNLVVTLLAEPRKAIMHVMRESRDGAAQSMAESRLHVPPATRVMVTALSVAVAVMLLGALYGTKLALPAWIVLLVLLVLAWTSLALWLWEVRYDRVGLSAPVMIFWRETHLWRELVEISDDIPFVWHFHFVDGTVLRVPKHLAGREGLMQMARDWLDHAGDDANARVA